MNFYWVRTSSEVQDMCHILHSFQEQPVYLGIDTEFIRESTFAPKLELIQVSAQETFWVIDAPCFVEKLEELQPFLDILKDSKFLKILHAGAQDQECLWMHFQTLMTPTFDTSIAASLCGYGDTVSLSYLSQSILGISLNKMYARTNWSMRPLPNYLVEYAISDVKYLQPIAHHLISVLKQHDRLEWALRLSSKWEKPEMFEYPALETAKKILSNQVHYKEDLDLLTELLAYRETVARKINIPRKWLITDQILQAICLVRPKNLTELGHYRGFNKGTLKQHGEFIFSLLKKHERSNTPETKIFPKTTSISKEEKESLELFSLFLQHLCAEKKIVSRYILPLESIQLIFEQPVIDKALLKKFLDEDTYHLLGEEILAFFLGKKTLKISQKKVHIIDLHEN